MHTIQHLRPADYRDMPWKNGGGTTCELFRLPHPANPDAFALRLSIATVASGGPFSSFLGIDRTLMLLEGEGMALRFEGEAAERVLDTPLQPIDFPGEAAVDCRLLRGSLRDFNVMVARNWGRAHTQIVEGEFSLVSAGGVTMRLVYVRAGHAQVGENTVQAHELLIVSGNKPIPICGNGTVLVMTVTAV
jgi:environmental stress-induced protein Ves